VKLNAYCGGNSVEGHGDAGIPVVQKVLSFVNESLSGAKLGPGVLMTQMGTLPASGE
jgi:hypothetical protein